MHYRVRPYTIDLLIGIGRADCPLRKSFTGIDRGRGEGPA